MEKGKKPREIFINYGGTILNIDTKRIFVKNAMLGQDDILYNRDT